MPWIQLLCATMAALPEAGLHPRAGTLVVSFHDALHPHWRLTAKLDVKTLGRVQLPVRDYGDKEVSDPQASLLANRQHLAPV